MNKSESIVQLARALTLAQKDMEKASMDSANPFFKSKYADLTSVWEACRKPLTDNGLSIVQTLDISGVSESQVLETILLHNSGEWISGILKLNPVKNDPQGMGSAITYARRYSLAAMVGICPEDDDGEGAMKRTKGVVVNPVTKRESPVVAAAKEAGAVGREHWCEEHQTEFFKKGKMNSYAHPIEGSDKWCYEHSSDKKDNEGINLGAIRTALTKKGYKTEDEQKSALLIKDWKEVADLEGVMAFIDTIEIATIEESRA